MTTPLVWSLPPVLAAAGLARKRLRAHLDTVPDEQLDTVVLATSEVVTNAVLHGEGPVVVHVWPGPEALRVEVSDDGLGVPRMRDVSSDEDEGGRGLHIVDVLATRWGVAPADPGPGKTVWFEVGKPPRSVSGDRLAAGSSR